MRSRPILVTLPGLNNPPTIFHEWTTLAGAGQVVNLPLFGHEAILPVEQIDLASSVEHTKQQIIAATARHPVWDFMGFSTGAALIQYMLLKNILPNPPRRQILLAPAMRIRHARSLHFSTKLFPHEFPLLSLAPDSIHAFRRMPLAYTKWLFELHNELQILMQNDLPAIPTLMAIDPKDELVDASWLEKKLSKQQSLWQYHQIKRQLKKRHPAKHHVIFYRDYYNRHEWDELISRLKKFLTD